MTSLRSAILVRMAGLLLAVGIVSATVTYMYVRYDTQSTFDSQIQQFATYIDALDPTVLAAKTPTSPLGAEDLFLVQVWDATGQLAWSSATADDAKVPVAAGYSNDQIGGAHWRSFTVISAPHTIRVSLPLDERNEQASSAALQIAIPMVIVIPLSWLVLTLMIDRIMGGLDRAARQIRSRRHSDTGKIAESGLPVEVQPFVTSINELVEHLNENVEQQKRFVSDAAHELRTPLTAIGIQISNLETVLSTASQRERLLPLKEGATRANQLVEKLLQLARAEKTAPLPQELESLNRVFAMVQANFAPISTVRRITLTFLNEAPLLRVDAGDLVLVLSALVENALAYAPFGSAVAVSAGPGLITVIDEGPGIAPEKLSQVFERFYRAANTRVSGTGLGLSIAKAICEARGWVLALENRTDRSGIIASIKLK